MLQAKACLFHNVHQEGWWEVEIKRRDVLVRIKKWAGSCPLNLRFPF